MIKTRSLKNLGKQTAKWLKTHSKKELEVPWPYFNMKTTGADNSKYVTGTHQQHILFLLWLIQRGLNFTRGLNRNLTKQQGRGKGDLLWCFQVCWRAGAVACRVPGQGNTPWRRQLRRRQPAREFSPLHQAGQSENGWRGLETRVWDVSSSGDLFLAVNFLP